MSLVFYASAQDPDVNDEELRRAAIEHKLESEKGELTNDKMLDEIKDHFTKQIHEIIDDKMEEIKQLLQAIKQDLK